MNNIYFLIININININYCIIIIIIIIIIYIINTVSITTRAFLELGSRLGVSLASAAPIMAADSATYPNA